MLSALGKATSIAASANARVAISAKKATRRRLRDWDTPIRSHHVQWRMTHPWIGSKGSCARGCGWWCSTQIRDGPRHIFVSQRNASVRRMSVQCSSCSAVVQTEVPSLLLLTAASLAGLLLRLLPARFMLRRGCLGSGRETSRLRSALSLTGFGTLNARCRLRGHSRLTMRLLVLLAFHDAVQTVAWRTPKRSLCEGGANCRSNYPPKSQIAAKSTIKYRLRTGAAMPQACTHCPTCEFYPPFGRDTAATNSRDVASALAQTAV